MMSTKLKSGSLAMMPKLSAVSLISMLAMGAPLQAQGIAVAAGENIERGPKALPAEGFVFSVEGLAQNADAQFNIAERRADIRLDRNDVQVKFDGLGAKPRLDALVVNAKGIRAGDTVEFQSRMNYPAFVRKGEIRIYADGGRKFIKSVAIGPNGNAQSQLPQGDDLVYSYRVYDAVGRYDETQLLPLAAENGRQISRRLAEDGGNDSTAVRNIAIRGGAVTVYVQNLMPGYEVSALGAKAVASSDGTAVINRILPVGAHDVVVNARGTTVIRPVEIPASDWFVTGVADLTVGQRSGSYDDLGQGRNYQYGRVQGYAHGFTASGWEITASADTQEDEVGNLLRNLTKRDPRSVLSRLDPDLYYPTYGDDSEMIDTTPTSSGLYVKAEREGSHALLGDFRSSITNTELLRNERALYGVQGVYQSQARTSRGEAKAAVELYGAQPEELPRRDQFRGTGGSSYFLSKRDVSVGSETVQIELRDPDTGRLIERKTLIYGQDYEINYAQGLVMLRKPLSSFASGTAFVNGGQQDGYYLIVQYEYVPLFEDLDGYSYGGRVETWLGDRVRVGVTGASDQTGDTDQTAQGADLRVVLGENSHVQIEQAQSDGPGFGSTFSSDGGMSITEKPAQAGKGSALRATGTIATNDIGLTTAGELRFSYETREAGFETLDRRTSEDETMGSLDLDLTLSERTAVRLGYAGFKADGGDEKTELTAELDYALSAKTELSLGYYYLDRQDVDRDDRSGKRNDIGVKIAHDLSDSLNVYGYGIATLSHDGQMARGDRAGVGAKWKINENWSFKGEASDGDAGPGALAHLAYEKPGSSAYIGYELEADRDRDTTTTSNPTDGGQFVAGGRKEISDSVAIRTESRYDMLGSERSLASSYGVEYQQNARLTHDVGYEFGRVHDREASDIERHAVSIGTRYDNKDGLALRGRIELRRDTEENPTSGDTHEDSVLLSGKVRYDLDDAHRIVGGLDLLRTDGTNEHSGDYTDFTIGYALRPVTHDKWNILAKYQYFYDLYGQTVNGTENRGPRQRSHVFSLDGNYRVSQHWTLGGKIGGRISEAQIDGAAWEKNDAYLGVINGRYHLPHEWDLLVEGRLLSGVQSDFSQSGLLLAAYKQVNQNMSVGVGYNFANFSDDLTDLVYDDKGFFINFVAKY